MPLNYLLDWLLNQLRNCVVSLKQAYFTGNMIKLNILDEMSNILYPFPLKLSLMYLGFFFFINFALYLQV